jgi:hypothetical protein
MLNLTRRLLTAIAIAAATGNAVAATTTINFDDLGPLAVLGSHYSALGVTFANAETLEYRSNRPVFCAFAGATCPGTIKSTDPFADGLQPQPSTPISATFSSPIDYASLTGLSIGPNGYLLRAYDAVVGGNLVSSAQIVVDGPLNNNSHRDLVVTGANIFRIEFSQLQYATVNNDIQFDNLAFEVQPVPEPAEYLLMLAGLGCIVGYTRYRRSRPRL